MLAPGFWVGGRYRKGFMWSIWEESWNAMYINLKEYKNYYKDCNVSCRNKEYKVLGTWVKEQIKLYKNDQLSENRIKKLQELDFKWDRNKNTSGIQGVCRDNARGKWVAKITIDNTLLNYLTKSEAISTYNLFSI